MSCEYGWAALNLEMPERIPRTEYSADAYHFALVKRVTGIDVSPDSPPEIKRKAALAFRKAWTFDFNWSTMLSANEFGSVQTRMGHADYAEGGRDFNAVRSCPFTDPEEVLAFDPFAVYGTIDESAVTRRFEAHYRANCESCPDEVNMTGTYITLMSGLIAIFGWDMLLTACGTDPARFGETANRYAAWVGQYMNALAKADVPCVMIHDDIVWTSGAFIHPDWYRKYVFPNYRKFFTPLLDSGKKLIFTSDGDYTMFVDDLVEAGVHGFVLEPCTDMRYIAEKYGKTHSFIGNADTRVLLMGSPEDIRSEVRRCMDIGRSCPGFMMAVGNHIPANTPVENCLIYEDEYRKQCRR